MSFPRTCIFLLMVSLAGCGDAAPKMDDQQILELFGVRGYFNADAGQKTIPAMTLDCLRLISGLDKEIYKDLPTEAAGRIKTDCRKKFSILLADQKRNPLGLTLAQLETRGFAERVAKAQENAEAAIAANRQAEQERKEQEKARAEAERIKSRMKFVEQQKARFAAISANLDDKLSALSAACEAWDVEYAAMKLRNPRSPTVFTSLRSTRCSQSFQLAVRKALKQAENYVARLSDSINSYGPLSAANFGYADPKSMDKEIEAINENTAAMRDNRVLP